MESQEVQERLMVQVEYWSFVMEMALTELILIRALARAGALLPETHLIPWDIVASPRKQETWAAETDMQGLERHVLSLIYPRMTCKEADKIVGLVRSTTADLAQCGRQVVQRVVSHQRRPAGKTKVKTARGEDEDANEQRSSSPRIIAHLAKPSALPPSSQSTKSGHVSKARGRQSSSHT
jgi:hypothetical protein